MRVWTVWNILEGFPWKWRWNRDRKLQAREQWRRGHSSQGSNVCKGLSKREHGKSGITMITTFIEHVSYVPLNTRCAVKLHLKFIWPDEVGPTVCLYLIDGCGERPMVFITKGCIDPDLIEKSGHSKHIRLCIYIYIRMVAFITKGYIAPRPFREDRPSKHICLLGV